MSVTFDFDIAIIGAGAAGIGAARRLSGSGLSILMIEAMPRPGGRAWTVRSSAGPLDLGCGWLHSADRNPWTALAGELGFSVDRHPSAWGHQFEDRGFSIQDHTAASNAFQSWNEGLRRLGPGHDRASDALAPDKRWNAYLQALSGYISGDELERISAEDYLAYDDASTDCNWRVLGGYGSMITSALPASVDLRLGVPLERLELTSGGVRLSTPQGSFTARAAILTMSSYVLASGTIDLPPALDDWRHAASLLPLGNNEKLFLEVVGPSPFQPETHVIGDPSDPETGSYYIMPLGMAVIECFLGGAGARSAALMGAEAAFARAVDQLTALFGASVRSCLKPLTASNWAGTASIGGGYSHALPGHAGARKLLARPYDDRIFFAGEATHKSDFSTAHGAYATGLRAAEEFLATLRSA